MSRAELTVSVALDLCHDLYEPICSSTDGPALRLALLSLIIFPGRQGRARSD